MTDDFPGFAGLPSQPDYAAMSDEWCIPRLVVDAWNENKEDDRWKIERSLERQRMAQHDSQADWFRFY